MTLGWILLVDAVAKIVDERQMGRQAAVRQIVTAARNGALYTQGRLHHAKGPLFSISPAAWDGMDPYPALSMLCTPNPGAVVQEPFLGAPKVCEVEIDGRSLDAWMAGHPRPPAPITQPVDDGLQNSPLVWRDLQQQFSGANDAAKTQAKPKANLGGRPPKDDWPPLEAILRDEISSVGLPHKEHELGWRNDADVGRWLAERGNSDEVSPKTFRKHAKKILDKIRSEGDQN